MKKISTYFFIVGSLLHLPVTLLSQSTDTLTNVQVFSKKPLDISTAVVPVQTLNRQALVKLNSVSVADAVKYFSGVLVKDYGGIGGLKTVSVRSLGASHTGVMYDGIMLGDAQGGQVDLGRFSLDNIESIQLFNNQPVDILLPARSYASASVIVLSSVAAAGSRQQKTDLNLTMKMGSFDFLNPSLYFHTVVNKNFSTGISAEYQSSRGNYSFKDYETGLAKKRRSNSDTKSFRVEYDAAWAFSDSNQLRFKAYYYDSKRGLPGAVILYNDFADDRLNNRLFFSQLHWQKNLSKKSRLLISGKYTADYKYYLDPSYQNSAGKLENKFYQKEFYLSAAYTYKIMPFVSLGYSVDYFINKLQRTDAFVVGFANPVRDNLLNNLSVQFKKRRLEITGNLLHSYITGKVEQGPVAKDLKELTPAIAASFQPLPKWPLRVRASYKKIFRAPSFDDLYYTNVGNANLRPEYATLYNAGITLNHYPATFIKEIIFTTDVFYNRVTDKILAVPRQNLFQWTILNIGKASIKGLDAAAHIYFKKWKQLEIATDIAYSYQQALDVSNPASGLYKTQLPYTPEHSGSVNISVGFKDIAASYNILSSSYRYRLGEPGPENVVQGWATHDITLSYALPSKKKLQYTFLAEAGNIYNKQYEIIKYYPMPRFNYRLGITASFKNKQSKK